MFETAKLVDAGVDYLRVTSKDLERQGTLFEYYQGVLDRDMRLGYKEERGGAFGFWGNKCRHALYGEKEEWCMLQVSGYEAKRALRVAVTGTQCTRIDIQCTYQFDDADFAMAMAYIDQCAQQHKTPKHRPPQITEVCQRMDIQTIYIGSRSSDVFVRIYKKFEESGKDEYRNCIRFEVELKGRASKALWQQIVSTGMGVGALLSILRNVLRDRGVEMPPEGFSDGTVELPPSQTTREEGTMAWLARQVAPAVARLSSSWGWRVPFNLLFAGACTEWDKHAIMVALSIVWGS